jgi:hypothetical protein
MKINSLKLCASLDAETRALFLFPEKKKSFVDLGKMVTPFWSVCFGGCVFDELRSPQINQRSEKCMYSPARSLLFQNAHSNTDDLINCFVSTVHVLAPQSGFSCIERNTRLDLGQQFSVVANSPKAAIIDERIMSGLGWLPSIPSLQRTRCR